MNSSRKILSLLNETDQNGRNSMRHGHMCDFGIAGKVACAVLYTYLFTLILVAFAGAVLH